MNNPYDVYPEYSSDKCDDCKKYSKHFIDITTPVDITPEVRVGDVEIECCGDPIVICDKDRKNCNACHLVFVQKISIKVPIRYDFKADVGESCTDCCAGKDK